MDISSLPRHLLNAILIKLRSTECLCRMRRTCSSFDRLVEENKMAFARRNMKGIALNIDKMWREKTGCLVFSDVVGGKIRLTSLRSARRMHQKFSGVIIESLFLHFAGFHTYDRELRQVTKYVKGLDFHYRHVGINGFPVDMAMEIAENVQAEEIRIQGCNYATLLVLNEARNRHRFIVDVKTSDVLNFEVVRNFKSARKRIFITHLEELQHFLWDMIQSPEPFNLSELNAHVVYDAYGFASLSKIFKPFEVDLGWPEFKVLWQLTEEEFEETLAIRDPAEAIYIPYCIRQMDLPFSRTALIVEFYSTFSSGYANETVYIVENDEGVILETLVEKLKHYKMKMDVVDRDRYFQADGETRIQLLREAHHWVSRRNVLTE